MLTFLICRILSFRSTKSTAYAITSSIFVFWEGIMSVVNLSFHFAYVRFGNTKDFFWILSTLDTISCQSTLPGADLYSKWSLANCQLAGRHTWKIIGDLSHLGKFYFSPLSSQKIYFLWVWNVSIKTQGSRKSCWRRLNIDGAIARRSLKAHWTGKLMIPIILSTIIFGRTLIVIYGSQTSVFIELVVHSLVSIM